MSPSDTPDATLLVPVLNEQATLRELLERLLRVPIDAQIVVIDDGSTDQTAQILGEYEGRVEVVRHESPRGKGSAIRSGLPLALGKVVVIQDADLEYAPEELPRLIEPILSGRANVVYGSRFTKGMPKGMAWPNRVVNRLLVLAVRLLFGARLTDEATCYKAFRRELLQGLSLRCTRFEFCPEVTAKALRRGERILEVPISYEPRNKAAGKKIRWTDAPAAFWTLLKYRFKGWR